MLHLVLSLRLRGTSRRGTGTQSRAGWERGLQAEGRLREEGDQAGRGSCQPPAKGLSKTDRMRLLPLMKISHWCLGRAVSEGWEGQTLTKQMRRS